MHALPGDRIVIRSHHIGEPIRDAEVLEVEHEDGSPPYRVRWSDTGHEALFFPGPDAFVDNEHRKSNIDDRNARDDV
ncbi:DUF1918 domain-containing protein [Nocardioides sp. NPDC006273]|uniref:DUF1918 domain-containing protein n=1 Tax=Nocardioides sp. NPDC006273 TaxID=3155598 RepID=UPI0033B5C444